MTAYVYRLVHVVDGYYYIGTTTQPIEDYWGSGVNLLRFPCCPKGPKYNQAHWEKEVLHKFRTKTQASRWERWLVDKKLLGDPRCLNKKEGGAAADPPRPESIRRDRRPERGKRRSPIDRETAMEIIRAVWDSELTRQQIADEFDVRRETVYNIWNHPSYKWACQRLADEIGVPPQTFRQMVTRFIKERFGRGPDLE